MVFLQVPVLLLIAFFAFISTPEQTLAQSLFVKPTKIHIGVKPGQHFRYPIQVKNTGGKNPVKDTLSVELFDMIQTENGSFSAVSQDPNNASSCKSWISLSQSTFELSPIEETKIYLDVKVPRNVRGVYSSAIIVRETGSHGGNIQLGFMIPVIFEIKGRPVRQKIEIDDLDILYDSQFAKRATVVEYRVKNEGKTFSTFRVDLRLSAKIKERWVHISDMSFDSKKIMPGMNLRATQEISKRLPSGNYKIEGYLYVDGRRVNKLQKVIEFEGDPKATKISADAALLLKPSSLHLELRPGATRGSVIRLENLSEDTLEIETAARVPPTLTGKMLGELRGDTLSCAEWIIVRPEKMTIDPGRRQVVRVIAKIPREEVNHPNYYSELILRANYSDGQSAGVSKAMVHLKNNQANTEYKAHFDKVLLSDDEGSKKIISCSIVNIGNVHYYPDLKYALLNGLDEKLLNGGLEGEQNLFMPMDTRNFSSVLNFDEIPEGTYSLVLYLNMAENESMQYKIPVHVMGEGGKKKVQVIDTDGIKS